MGALPTKEISVNITAPLGSAVQSPGDPTNTVNKLRPPHLTCSHHRSLHIPQHEDFVRTRRPLDIPSRLSLLELPCRKQIKISETTSANNLLFWQLKKHCRCKIQLCW